MVTPVVWDSQWDPIAGLQIVIEDGKSHNSPPLKKFWRSCALCTPSQGSYWSGEELVVLWLKWCLLCRRRRCIARTWGCTGSSQTSSISPPQAESVCQNPIYRTSLKTFSFLCQVCTKSPWRLYHICVRFVQNIPKDSLVLVWYNLQSVTKDSYQCLGFKTEYTKNLFPWFISVFNHQWVYFKSCKWQTIINVLL